MGTGQARPLAITMGEPAGIGPDLILSLYAGRQSLGLPAFAVFGHEDLLRSRAARLGLELELAGVAPEEAASVFDRALPVVSIESALDDTPGTPDPNAAPVVVGAVAQAAEAIHAGVLRAMVTAPIHKAALYGAGFPYPGHTEFLAALSAEDGPPPLPVMMLVHDDLRVVPLTIHIPLAEVAGAITGELIVQTVRIVAGDLAARFAIAAPRIAIAGLNPHAGEDGEIGSEEIEIIAPAADALRAEGILVTGPLSADTLFHPPHWRRYDCVVAMYHDQALIPIKTVGFDSGVNVTLGLPFVRTSPDHGTALSLAGTGKTSPNSMLAAIRLADRLS